jgi:3-oxoacyl-[acyl-carrier-protein] synthase-3
LLETASAPYALVIGTEQISTRLDMTDRNTCILFGDGAGAAIVRLKPETELFSVLGSEGMKDVLGCTGQNMGKPYIFMDGQRVFKNAVKRMGDAAKGVLEMSGLTINEIDYVVCHQANERIIDSVCKKLEVPEEKIFKNISKYGNTSAATIPIALDEMNEAGMLKEGQKILLATFGAGFTWASMIIET